jgi:CheY-like chemotaxis protein
MQSNNLKIMLIDDDVTNNIITKKLLLKYNPSFSVQEYKSANEALTALKNGSFKPSLIFLDINMPDMNGWQFLDKFTALRMNVSIYLLTSSVDVLDIERAKTSQYLQGFISKPLTQMKIQQVLDESF